MKVEEKIALCCGAGGGGIASLVLIFGFGASWLACLIGVAIGISIIAIVFELHRRLSRGY